MTESLALITQPNLVVQQQFFDSFPCIPADICGRIYEWIDSCLWTTATVLSVVGIALAFFHGSLELVFICSVSALINGYHLFANYQSSDDLEIERDAAELEVVEQDVNQERVALEGVATKVSTTVASGKNSVANLQKVNRDLQGSVSSLEKQLADQRASEEAFKIENARLLQTIKDEQLRSQPLNGDIEALKKVVDDFTAQKLQFGAQIGVLGQEKTQLTLENSQLKERTEHFNKLVDQLMQQLANKIAQADEATKKILIDYTTHQKSLDATIKQLQEAKLALGQSEQAMASKLELLQKFDADIKQKNIDLEALSTQLTQTKNAFVKAEQDLEAQNKKFQELNAKNSATQAELQKTLERLRTAEQQVVTAENAFTKQLKEFEDTKNATLIALESKIQEKLKILQELAAKAKPPIT